MFENLSFIEISALFMVGLQVLIGVLTLYGMWKGLKKKPEDVEKKEN